MKIYDTDDIIVRLAKKAAMICLYSIKNPLHCYFDDGNLHDKSMDRERKFNELFKKDNGENMFEFVDQFLDVFETLDISNRKLVYMESKKKLSYLYNKWNKKIKDNSDLTKLVYHKHYLEKNGCIYVETNNGTKIKQF